MGQINISKSESCHTNLSNGSIVHDLIINDLIVNDLTNLGLHEQVLGLSNSVVKSMMVDLAQECSDPHLR